MSYWLIVIPVISALIGWFTNWIAIKMLFHPRNPIKFFGIIIHGIFPKRQKVFAEKMGKLVGEELLSFADIESKITSPEQLKKIMPLVEQHIDDFLRKKLASSMPVISMFIGENTINQLKGIFLEELETLFPNLMKNYTQSLKADLDLEQIVTQKIASFSSDKLEQILQQVMSKEFRFIEILGGVLGFIIGVFQVIITLIIL